MKIVIITNEYPPKTGGAGVVAKRMYDDYSNAGHDAVIISPIAINDKKVNSIKLKVYKFFALSYFGIDKIVNNINPDLLIVNDMPAIYSCSLFMSKNNIKKSKCFIHGSEPEVLFGDKNTMIITAVMYKYFYKLFLQQCKASIFVSHFLKKKFNRIAGYLPENSRVVNPTVDTGIFNTNKSELNNPFLDNSETLVLFSASRIIKEKGYADMLILFNELSQMHRLKWYIAGDGDYLNEFKELVARSRYAKNVIFLGRQPHQKLVTYYQFCDIFWLLSNLKESFGLVYAEAQACGAYCIGRSGSGIVESLDLDFCYLFESKKTFIYDFDKIKMLCKNKKHIHVHGNFTAGIGYD
ncbi:glycosyltransferase family 4 protein [Aliivibrio fischeri]|uniref:glycosyltransferase family 4 protein n=1 Tax=Aliivibrio fischeri TaxID=668 RepID=UPI0012D86DA4|nr:glycosyltransferase family 4 protein [Aliivibrio fischeri]MUK26518.1 glycosyltransferase [Aliivibrio fischeri]MUK33720.1 glycosyltransferase [Aliivibrio fischeri]